MTDLRKLTNATLRVMIEKAGIDVPDLETLTKKELIAVYEGWEREQADAVATQVAADQVPEMPDVVTCVGCGRELHEVPEGDWMLVLPMSASKSISKDPNILLQASHCSGCANAKRARDPGMWEVIPVEAG